MKINYTTAKLFRTVLFAIIALFSTSTIFAQTAETTVFADDFGGDNLSGGAPTTTYTIFKTVGAGDDPADPNTTTTAGLLRIGNRKGTGFFGRNGVTGVLSTYIAPFTSKISEIVADSLVWTFNMRQNYNSTLSGFGDSQNGVAAILVADNANVSLANGYAILYGGDGVKRYRLVKFVNGLYSNDNITNLVIGQTSPTDGRDYMSFRVVYVPATNLWRFYDRFDGPNTGGAFANPAEGTMTLSGTTVNSDITNTLMTNFGFFQSYYGNIDKVMWVDNYTVKAYKTDVSTSIGTNVDQNFYKATIVDGGIKIDAKNAKATLYDSKGALIKSIRVTGSGNINVIKRGLFILKMQSENGETKTERLIL